MSNNQEISSPLLIEDLGMLYATEKSKYKKRFGIYKCQCGKIFKTVAAYIKNGHTNSCGCHKINRSIEANTTHGLKHHKMFNIWRGIIARCTNNKVINYSNYGGRGITVCERWKDINNFIEDMYPSYQEGLTIDRINNDGNYEPSNCRWATKQVQHRNTRLIMSTNKSGYRGVCFSKQAKKFTSQIKVNRKQKYLGTFNTSNEAAIAYDTFVIVYGLEHTTNFPKGIFETNKKEIKCHYQQ